MTSITFNVPDSVDINALISALENAGIRSEQENGMIPLDAAIRDAFPDMTKREIIGGMLKAARENTKLTQSKLGEMVDENKSNISAMERGKRSISKKMAQKLAKALNVPYHIFF
jgi:DNA-binding XRE family transcriptional regulator